jgi:predicted MFS family arabinose efflux permease
LFVIAPRAGRLSPRILLIVAGALAAGGQIWSAFLTDFFPLLASRVVTGLGFGLANAALNLAAARSAHPARAISIGIAIQTLFYAAINIVLPMIGARYGVAGMFGALAVLSIFFTFGAWALPAGIAFPGVPNLGVSKSALGSDAWQVLAAMALFTFGSLAIWPFMERAAHAIGISAVVFGRYQSAATLLSAFGNVALAVVSTRVSLKASLACALLTCACACGALTTVTAGPLFGLALIVFNMSWFVCYPLLLGIAYSVDTGGRLSVLCSAVWLLMMSLGSLMTGILAHVLGGYRAVGPLGMTLCLAAMAVIWPLAARADRTRRAIV